MSHNFLFSQCAMEFVYAVVFTVILCTGAHVGRGFSLHCLPEDHTVL